MLDNMPRGTICIEDIEMGMTRDLKKVVTNEDIELFAKVTTIITLSIWMMPMHKIRFLKDGLPMVC